MRVLIIGNLSGQLSAATKIAFERGAQVSHAPSAAIALDALRAGQGADLVMVDVKEDIAWLYEALQTEHIAAPIVACGVEADANLAADAIRAGAKEFIPLPPEPDLIAAIL
jgi:DNA-binding NtrC family response regulator